MTRKEVIEKVKKSNELELPELKLELFKTNKKTKKRYEITHSCKTLDQLEQLVKELMIGEREHFYNVEIV